jgi:pyridoxal 5'-phosphate synthase pdxT subunit
MKIGVLALQGAFAEHIAVLRKLGVEAVEIRLPEQLEGLDGLIIPGGESTTFSILMKAYGFVDKIARLAKNGFPIFGTCAGMIVLANGLTNDGGVEPVGAMAMRVTRNAFGRQVDSFEAELAVPTLGKKPFHGVFIRAPRIESVGKNVEVLAKLNDGTIAAARQGKILVTSFHPELSGDTRFHKYFLDIVSGKQ